MSERSIGEVVELLIDDFPDISISKIRFLETRGLVCPQRSHSGYRRYSERDIAQLRWVLRLQRDQYLPLRVIHEQLKMGELSEEELAEVGPSLPVTRIDSMKAPEHSLELTGQEIAERSGIGVEDLADMENFGLLAPKIRAGRPVYNGDDLIAARLVARFAAHGIKARQLRSFRVAAESAGGLIQQRLSRMSSVSERDDALRELVRLSEDLRALLLRQALHSKRSHI